MNCALGLIDTIVLTYLVWFVLLAVAVFAALVGLCFLARWLWRRLHSRQVACYDGSVPAAPQEEKVP